LFLSNQSIIYKIKSSYSRYFLNVRELEFEVESKPIHSFKLLLPSKNNLL
jgi:hypothetical protein